MNAEKWLSGVVLALILISNGWGQQYTKLNVKNRVQLDVPADWTMNNLARLISILRLLSGRVRAGTQP